MTAGPKIWTETKLAERIRKGLGCGSGTHYLPAIRIQDFSSRGVQTRTPSEVLGRTVHTHSYLERALFLVTEFRGNLLEYREQFPMERAVTLGAAKKLGIRHPVYPKSGGMPVVMTLDALVTERAGPAASKLTAWDVKPHAELQNRRVLEKLTLHKAYCAYSGILHRVFTERSLNKVVVQNIDWLRSSRQREGEREVVDGLFTTHAACMLDEIRSGNFKLSVRAYGLSYDRRRQLPPGTGLRLVKHLAWTHVIELDLTVDPIELQPLPRPRHVGKANRHGEIVQ